MASKKYDLVVVTGEYTTRDGNTKKTYETVGALFEGDKGPYLMIKRTFNFAALAADKDSVLVSCYEPRQQGGAPSKSSGGFSGKPVDDDQSFPF